MKKALCLLIILVMIFSVGCSDTGREEGEVDLIEVRLTEEEYAFGIDKNQPELLKQANDFIAKLIADGTLDEICKQYFEDADPKAVISAEEDRTKDQLVVATNLGFEPFEYIKGDQYYGIDLEIASQFAQYLGKELVIVNMDFEAVCLAVGQGKCDMAMAGLTVKDDRKQYVNFTNPYYLASQTLLVKRGDTTFDHCKTAEDVERVLRSKDASTKIGVQTGTTAQYYVEGDEEWGFDGFDISCIGYKSAALAVQDMLNGNVDFVIIDEAPAVCIAKAFEGSDFARRVEKFWEIFYENNGYERVLEGLKNTLLIAIAGLLIGAVIGTLIATVRVIPKYKRLPRFLNGLCSVYVGFFRGTPIVVQLLLGYYVLLPLLGLNYASLYVCIVVFGLNSGAYVSEIMRGGIRAVDPGQLEAGRAVGMSFSYSMWKIVIPQAVKNILPTLGNEFISLIKETSVVSFVGTLDIYVAFNAIGTNSYEFMVPYLVMAIVYIILVAFISLLIKWMERRLTRGDRHLASK